MPKRPITTLLPWYGSGRNVAPQVGKLLDGKKLVGVPFVGGGPELREINAKTIVCSDLHLHVINLWNTLRGPSGERLERMVKERVLHVQELRAAQLHCIEVEQGRRPLITPEHRLDWAAAYFTCCWMGRNGVSGTPGEFGAKLCTRWTAGGGDPATRYRSAAHALAEFRAFTPRCTFETLDFRPFLGRMLDRSDHKDVGIYIDSPFYDAPGKKYTHGFENVDHLDLAKLANTFQHAGVVVRLYQHPDVDARYPTDQWARVELPGRDQHQKTDKPERLLCRNIDPINVIRARAGHTQSTALTPTTEAANV